MKEPKFRSVGKINPVSDKVLDTAVVIDMSEVDLAGFLAGLEELHPSTRCGTPVKIMLTAEETALPYQRRALDCARGRLLLYLDENRTHARGFAPFPMGVLDVFQRIDCFDGNRNFAALR